VLLQLAGGFSVEGGFGEDDMARYGSTMPITPGHVRRLVADGTRERAWSNIGVVKTSDVELGGHLAHKFLHNVPLADRSFSGMGLVLRHAMCRVAHGEGRRVCQSLMPVRRPIVDCRSTCEGCFAH
jgi:hypothetical protein